MRTLKFKAWNKNFDGVSKPFKIHSDVCDFTDENGLGNIKSLTDEVIIQFTGFTDKNGKEIYEGDILITEFEADGEKLKGYEQVFLDEKKGMWVVDSSFKQDKSCSEPLWEVLEISAYTIVGNIYQNAKLLSQI